MNGHELSLCHGENNRAQSSTSMLAAGSDKVVRANFADSQNNTTALT